MTSDSDCRESCEEAAVLSRLVDRALATQHHVLLVVATRLVLMPRRSLHFQVDASPITGREISGMVGISTVPLVLLGYGHVACIDKTMALLLSLWLSCGGGAFKTFEDVLLSIRSITTDIGVEAESPSIDNVLSHFAAVVKRSVPGSFQTYSRLLPQCVHVHGWLHLWSAVIQCGFEADEC